jgi:hypothetical protein
MANTKQLSGFKEIPNPVYKIMLCPVCSVRFQTIRQGRNGLATHSISEKKVRDHIKEKHMDYYNEHIYKRNYNSDR